MDIQTTTTILLAVAYFQELSNHREKGSQISVRTVILCVANLEWSLLRFQQELVASLVLTRIIVATTLSA